MFSIIDTNIIANDPFFFNSLKNHTIIIPMVVLEELDKIKSYEGITGKNARSFIHLLREGIKTKKLGNNKLVFAKDGSKDKVNDNTIINTALRISKKHKNVTLFTNDINMQLKAKLKGVNALSFDLEKPESIYQDSFINMVVTESVLSELSKGHSVQIDKMATNKYVIVNSFMLAKYDSKTSELKKLVSIGDGILGLKPKNIEQKFALDALLDDNIKLVSLIGTAGTGKTLLATAAALHKVLDQYKYDGVVIARPTTSMGNDLGYLPGTMEEKLFPWMQPFFDNIDFLMGDGKKNITQELLDQRIINFESLSHIRGRSFNKKYIIIDEAQNLNKHELKTIISRAGEGTKIVLTGDVYQIDTKSLDIENNGLTYVAERFANESIAANVNLSKSERSKLAELACKLL